jgi:twitching motility protein PilT
MRSRVKWVLFNLDCAIDHERLQAIIRAADVPDPVVLAALARVADSDPSMEHRVCARRSIAAIRARLGAGVAGIEGASPPDRRSRVEEALASCDAHARVEAIHAVCAHDFPEKLELLGAIEKREKDPSVRSELVRCLVTLGPAGVALVHPFLAEPDTRVRIAAVEALAAIATPDAHVRIVPVLLDADERARKAATSALNRIGKASLLDVLARMIEDREPAMRDAAVHALELLARGGHVEADALLADHRRRSPEPAPSPGAGDASNLVARAEALEPVVRADMLEDRDPDLRIAEVKSIIRMKAYERAGQIAARIKVEQDRNVLSCMVLALGRLRAREYASLARKHLKSGNERIRASAVESLGLMEDRSALAEVTGLLCDPSARVRVNAILALRGQPGHDPHARLAACLDSASQALRRSALYGLLELRDEKAVEILAQRLSDADVAVRETAMEFLAILGSEGVVAAAHACDEAYARGLRAPVAAAPTRAGRGTRVPRYSLDELLVFLKEVGGSDLHLNAGVEPSIRLHGEVRRVRSLPLTADDTRRLLFALLSEDQVVKLETNWSLDFSYSIRNVARFRVNVFREARGYKGVFRLVPMDLPTLDGLSLPPLFRRLCHARQGLVLVTGPAGSGKSTTLAAMVNEINTTEPRHIITVEDPIEFIHAHRTGVVSQRELSVHAHTFAGALRDALREDPNVILVGEMRDLETMSLAVTAAETGHLVLSTLHTSSAAQSIHRIVDVYPPGQQDQARQQLASSLVAIVSQRLVPAATGEQRVLALEIMVNTPAVANLIREGKTEQICTLIQVSHEAGMMTLDAHLAQLVAGGSVARDVAVEYAADRKSFLAAVGRSGP